MTLWNCPAPAQWGNSSQCVWGLLRKWNYLEIPAAMWPDQWSGISSSRADACGVKRAKGRFKKGPKQNDKELILSTTHFVQKVKHEYIQLSAAYTETQSGASAK